MNSEIITLKKQNLINFLKSFPEEELEEIFLELLIESEEEPLSEEERERVKVALQEYQKGETVKWEDIK